jgi:predicted transcriptional regulator
MKNIQYKKLSRPKGSGKGPTRIESRDRMIKAGMSAHKIAYSENITHQAASFYIHSTGQYGYWKQRRKEVQESEKNKRQEEEAKERVLSDIIASVIEYKTISGYKDKEAAQTAWKYKTAHSHSPLNLDKLYKLFSRYNKAQKKGKRLSLKELCAEAELDPANAGKILKAAGLAPMYGSRERYLIPEDKKQAMKRVAKSSISAPDIAYFLDLPGYSVCQYRIRNDKQHKIKDFPRIDARKISYRIASQVYEAEYLGFSDEETAQLLEVSQGYVNYVLKDKELKEDIKEFLQKLYPDKRITKPYRNFSSK